MSQLSPAGHMAATLLLILLASAAAAAVSADQQVSACQNDIDALWRSCKQFVQKEGPKMPPSEDCCKTIKALDAHASCICDYVGSPDARNKLDLDKVFFVTKQCGVTVPKGCGEYNSFSWAWPMII